MFGRLQDWKRVSAGVSCVLLLSVQAALAGPMDDGKKAYAARRYSEALNYFGQAGRQTPADPNVYYYLGLCYQGTHQYTMARQNFQYVASIAGGSPIGLQAQQALAQLDKSHPASGGQQSPSQQQFSGLQMSAQEIAKQAGGGTAARPQIAGHLRVYEFWTKWCKYCTEFKPVWEQVSSQLRSKADFRSIDAEADPDTAKRFNVTRFPRVIYVDGNGKVLLERSWYKTPDDFKRDLAQFVDL